jgi:hypothetical protein
MQRTPEGLHRDRHIKPWGYPTRLPKDTREQVVETPPLHMLLERDRLPGQGMGPHHKDHLIGMGIVEPKGDVGQGDGVQAPGGVRLFPGSALKVVDEAPHIRFDELGEEVIFVLEIKVERFGRVADAVCQTAHGEPAIAFLGH